MTVPAHRGSIAPPLRSRERKLTGLAFLGSVVVWLGLLLIGVAYGVMVQMLGSTYCETFAGSSQYGELNWSIIPPGPTCTFTTEIHGFNEVRGPTPVMSIWITLLVAGTVGIIWLARRYSQQV